MMYDLMIVGGGPGGIKAAERAGKSGMRVVLFEEDQLGGVCLNHGCIPTKSLLYGVKLFNRMKKDAGKFGIEYSSLSISPDVLWRKAKMSISSLRRAVEMRLKQLSVEVIFAKADWDVGSDEFSVVAAGKTYRGKRLIIATGGKPCIPQITGIDQGIKHGWIVPPKELLSNADIPKSLIILGGGAIGLEMATIFSSLGTHTTIVEQSPFVGGCSSYVSSFLRECYRKNGVTIKVGKSVERIGDQSLILSDGHQILGDKLLLSCGWKSILNEKLDNIPGMFVIGDARGETFSAHSAEMEAILAVDKILGGGARNESMQIPRSIFSSPEVFSVGKCLREALLEDASAYEKIIPLGVSSRYAVEHSGENGFGVCVYSGKGELLGVELVGEGVIELGGALFRRMPIHPSLSEFMGYSGRFPD